jgi:hypothetical protein
LGIYRIVLWRIIVKKKELIELLNQIGEDDEIAMAIFVPEELVKQEGLSIMDERGPIYCFNAMVKDADFDDYPLTLYGDAPVPGKGG